MEAVIGMAIAFLLGAFIRKPFLIKKSESRSDSSLRARSFATLEDDRALGSRMTSGADESDKMSFEQELNNLLSYTGDKQEGSE